MSQSEQEESAYHATAVALAVNEQSGGDCHEEVTQIGGHLYESRLCDTDVERILEMLVEHIENSACETPHEEE